MEVSFPKHISLGNVLTIIAMIGGCMVTYAAASSRVAVLEEKSTAIERMERRLERMESLMMRIANNERA